MREVLTGNSGMSSQFDRNIKEIVAGGGFVDTAWLESHPDSVCGFTAMIEPSRSGLPNIVFIMPGGKNIHAHNLIDPTREAARFIEKQGDLSGCHIVVYGIGAGHHIAEIAEAAGENGEVTVLECSPVAARIALENIDFTETAAIKNVRLLIGPGNSVVRAAGARVREIERESAELKTKLYVHKASLDILSKTEHDLCEFLCRLRDAFYIEYASGNKTLRSAFRLITKKIFSGIPLSDVETAALYIESAWREDRFYFHDAAYKRTELPEKAASILVISLSYIGDVVQTSSVFNGIREKYPDARIVFLTEKPSETLYERNPEIDRVIGYSREEIVGSFRKEPRWSNFKAACGRFLDLANELRAEKFDLVINLHPSARSAILAGAAGAHPESRIGISVGADGVSVIRGNVWQQAKILDAVPCGMPHEENFIKMFGVSPSERRVGVRVPVEESERIAAPYVRRNERGPAIGVNPFVSSSKRNWSTDNFMRLCRIITEEWGREVLIFAGAGESEREVAEKMRDEIGSRASCCAGEPPDRAALVARECALFITNDTGPMHFSATAGARILVVSGPTLTLPYSTLGHVSISSVIPCAGCGPFSECDKELKCFKDVEPSHVADVASVMLDNNAEDSLRKLSGVIGDGGVPHRLLTPGMRKSLTPRFTIRLRDTISREANIAVELIRIAAFNVLNLVEAGSLASGRHPAGVDRPGLTSVFSPDTAVREVLDRHFFSEISFESLRQFLDIMIARLSTTRAPDKLTAIDARLFTQPLMMLQSLEALDMLEYQRLALASCVDFLSSARHIIAKM